jgi:hypothetical protein
MSISEAVSSISIVEMDHRERLREGGLAGGEFGLPEKKVKIREKSHPHFGVLIRLLYRKGLIWHRYSPAGPALRALAAGIWLILCVWSGRFRPSRGLHPEETF